MSRLYHRPADAPTSAMLVAAIIDATAEKYGVTAGDIRGRRQYGPFASARQVAQALSVELTGETNLIVGTLFDLDASTVAYASRKVIRAEHESPQFASRLNEIRAAVEARVPNARWRSQSAIERHNRTARVSVDAEAELDRLLRDLRRGLMAALRADPGRLLAGLQRTTAEINDREARP